MSRTELGKVLTDKLEGVESQEERTAIVHEWMKGLPDGHKKMYAINWNRIPHTLFNITCNFVGGYKKLQNICWWTIHKSRDLGNWSHGGPVFFGY